MPNARLPYDIIVTTQPADVAYRGILDRLLNDVVPPMEVYRRTGVGNWASMRMLAPVIEAVSKNNTNKRNKLLREIGINYPVIFWTMYRHGLMHNDSMPQSVQLGDESIGWGFNWEQKEAAVVVGNCYSLNPAIIFDNLVSWLRMQLLNNTHLKDELLQGSELVVIKPEKVSTIKAEFNEMRVEGKK